MYSVGNPTLFHGAKSNEKKYLEKINIGTINWKKSFLIDPLTTDNAIYRDLLTLMPDGGQSWYILQQTYNF